MTPRPADTSRPLVTLKGVSFSYPGCSGQSPPVLDGVSLEVYPRDRLGIVGPNGGGKTTLVKIVLGLFHPSSGVVTLCGGAARWSAHFPEVGYIGNPSRNDGESGLPLDLTVGKLLDSHQALFRQSGWDYPHVMELAAKLDLDKPEWRQKCVFELSDGWRQRVLSFLALAKQPKLLIADEATVGLDPEHRKTLLEVVRHAADTTGMAVMWVTHSFYELFYLGLKVLRVEQGNVQPLSPDGWECEITTNGGELRVLSLSADAVIDLFGDLALDPRTRSIRLNMVRPRDAEGKS